MLIGRNVSLNVARNLIAYTIYCDELLGNIHSPGR